MNDDGILEAKEYALACSQMGKRTRFWLRLLTIASLVALGVYWTSRYDDYAEYRLTMYRDALHQMTHGDTTPEKAPDIRPLQISERRDRIRFLTSHFSIDELKERISELEKRQLKKQTFHTPVVDLDFDIEDLAAISGLAFLTLIILLRLSTLKELIVTRLAFARCRPSRRFAEFYERSCLLQTSLGSAAEKRNSYLFWAIAEKSLIFVPLYANSLILQNNLSTLALGDLLSRRASVVALVSAASSGASLAFAGLCLYDWLKIDRLWEAARHHFHGLVIADSPSHNLAGTGEHLTPGTKTSRSAAAQGAKRSR